MKDLLRIVDLTPQDLLHLLDVADEAKLYPKAACDLLAGDIVVTYFAEPSTRTRLSLAAAVTRLGGTVQVVGPTELQVDRGETIEDTAAVISRYARAFTIRTFDDDDVRRFAAAATIPVINALSDTHHPLQALADLQTLRQHFGSLEGLKVAYVGDGNNVCHSLLEACALAGVDISVATPPGFEPQQRIVELAESIAERSGSVARTMHDPYLAVYGAHAVYTDVWLSMGTPESERNARISALQPYRVDQALLFLARDDAVFLHCLPAHRGEEVTADVIDGPRSLVFDQAENRMHTAVAVLRSLIDSSLIGSATLAMAHARS